jgi:hypothetical protein
MNLLKVQDALKNASDQQLMGLMQAPDSTAPSYLVLSEIRRRKDMRSKQAPEGQPNRTVADELLAQDDGGIRDIVAHDEPEAQDGAEEMAAGGLASLRRYAEGGVIRMSDGFPGGGAVSLSQLGMPTRSELSSPSRSLQEMSALDVQRYMRGDIPGYSESEARMELLRRGLNPATLSPMPGNVRRPVDLNEYGGPPIFSGAAQPPASAVQPAVTNRASELDAMISSLPERPNVDSELAARGVRPSTPTATTTPPTAAQPPAAQPPAARPAAAQPTPAPATRPQGIEALRPGSAEGTEPSQSSVQFADRLSPLFARMQEGRVDPAARRNEAMNMALIEAGLRIASSRNPSLAGAIGEGAAPAVQAYSQQLGQIRQDQRQDLRDELQGALAQNQNDYYRGRLSQQEFATRQQMIIERLRQDREDTRTGLREAGATARNAATVAAADRPPEAARLFRAAMGRDPRPGNQEDLAILYRLNERYDPARATAPAEIRGAGAMARSIQDAINSDRSIQMMRIQRADLERRPNRTQAQDQELAALLERIGTAEQAIEQRFLRLGSGAGGLPMSDRPVGSGAVVQAPLR